MAVGPLARDAPSTRLKALEHQLRDELGHRALIERSQPAGTRVEIVQIRPTNPRSCSMTWVEMTDELLFTAARQWDLDRTDHGVALIESLVRAVIAGRIVETFAHARSWVDIALDDGAVMTKTGYDSILLFPIPRWRRRGRTVRYEPY